MNMFKFQISFSTTFDFDIVYCKRNISFTFQKNIVRKIGDPNITFQILLVCLL